jgi:hypothetical protein
MGGLPVAEGAPMTMGFGLGVTESTRTAVLGAALLGITLLACGGSVARYEGTNYPAVVSEDDIKEAKQLPEGETVIGQVVGRCIPKAIRTTP